MGVSKNFIIISTLFFTVANSQAVFEKKTVAAWATGTTAGLVAGAGIAIGTLVAKKQTESKRLTAIQNLAYLKQKDVPLSSKESKEKESLEQTIKTLDKKIALLEKALNGALISGVVLGLAAKILWYNYAYNTKPSKDRFIPKDANDREEATINQLVTSTMATINRQAPAGPESIKDGLLAEFNKDLRSVKSRGCRLNETLNAAWKMIFAELPSNSSEREGFALFVKKIKAETSNMRTTDHYHCLDWNEGLEINRIANWLSSPSHQPMP